MIQKRQFNVPRLLISRCLEFDAVRYDGTMIKSPFVKRLKPFVDAIPICPEVEIGLGIPRETIRLVRVKEEDRMIQPATGRDLTDAMRRFSRKFLDQVPPLDGFILKNRSPTSALKDAFVYPSSEKSSPLGKAPGIFTREILLRYPHHPMEDEGRLRNHRIRDHFLTCIYTLADFRKVREKGTFSDLIRFHTQNKLLLLGHHQALLSQMGQLVAHAHHSPNEVIIQYEEFLLLAMENAPRTSTNINMLLHAFGHVSHSLSGAEKAFFLDVIAQYRSGQVSLAVPKNLLKAWIVRFDEESLREQTFFAPYPDPLMEPEAWEDEQKRDYWRKAMG
jgi:uncharacterized protein YbgA (DUF1722 family)/uncharacterized protein YbbK (DUF523 family)